MAMAVVHRSALCHVVLVQDEDQLLEQRLEVELDLLLVHGLAVYLDHIPSVELHPLHGIIQNLKHHWQDVCVMMGQQCVDVLRPLYTSAKQHAVKT